MKHKTEDYKISAVKYYITPTEKKNETKQYKDN
jgi:hypothetical protein